MSLRLLRAALSAVLLLLVVQACRLRPPLAPEPVPEAASQALREGEAILRASATDKDGRAQAALERAIALAPGWVAPRRLLDECLRGDLRGVEALALHLERLEAPQRSDSNASNKPGVSARDREARDVAAELYLAGRLEGIDGVERFEQAVHLDPDLAWGHHGLAWAASVRGDASDACTYARRALERARGPWERTFFAVSLARFLVASGKREKALDLLEERAHDEDLAASERLTIAIAAVGIGLEDPTPRGHATSYERGLELLRAEDLSDAEVDELTARLRALPSFDDPDMTSLQLALAARSGPARDRARAELMLDAGATPLALGLFERALGAQGKTLPAGALVRAARFAAGDFVGAVELWRASLPAAVIGTDGLPTDERLARIVRAAYALPRAIIARDAHSALKDAKPPADSQDLVERTAELGEALISAGWFREARGVATQLAAGDLDRALSLESRALAGLDLFEGLRRMLRRVDREHAPRATLAPASSDDLRRTRVDARPTPVSRSDRATSALGSEGPTLGSEPRPMKTLDDLLGALAPLIARADVFLGGTTDVHGIEREIESSPRMRYAAVAELVHPGPILSEDDERDGLGRAGARAGGLAAILERFGRFGLFGEVSGGGGPDATVLPLLYVEQRSGVHLGVHWRGTVAWCESADLKSRAGRRGAQIAAAALHEGYWIDVDAVRGELVAWDALRTRFAGAGADERVTKILSSRGLAAETPAQRTRTGALLGEAQRVRLAVLRSRARSDPSASLGEALGKIGLDELLAVTGAHEEGHLCDRTRFLPIGQHKLAILGFLFDCGFSPARVGEALEYRAQLTCICDAQDPRIPLAQVLDSVEAGPSGITPHAAGYARLLTDLVSALDAEIASYSSLDPGHTIAHQLHVLAPEDLRRAARGLARSKGLL